MIDTTPSHAFGCRKCQPDSAEEAAETARGFEFVKRLIDESHYIVSILRCPHCAQAYLSVFTETIDWTDGEDPQYRTLLPIEAQEQEALVREGEDLRESTLNALGRERRSLRIDFPKGAPKRMFWGLGLFVGPHD
jgi:hypothetical protein